MKYNPNIHHRRSIRLQGYDYSREGAYFVTICAKRMKCLFGEIAENDKGGKYCRLSNLGKAAQECWRAIPQHYPNVILDEFIVMPNHIHGILFLEGSEIFPPASGAQNLVPVKIGKQAGKLSKINQFQKIIPRSIGAIVRGFKIGVTKWARANTLIHEVWHRNYHERIIRNEEALSRIRKYIIGNPENWKKDKFLIT